jgi:hypothetical protein
MIFLICMMALIAPNHDIRQPRKPASLFIRIAYMVSIYSTHYTSVYHMK